RRDCPALTTRRASWEPHVLRETLLPGGSDASGSTRTASRRGPAPAAQSPSRNSLRFASQQVKGPDTHQCNGFTQLGQGCQLLAFGRRQLAVVVAVHEGLQVLICSGR